MDIDEYSNELPLIENNGSVIGGCSYGSCEELKKTFHNNELLEVKLINMSQSTLFYKNNVDISNNIKMSNNK